MCGGRRHCDSLHRSLNRNDQSPASKLQKRRRGSGGLIVSAGVKAPAEKPLKAAAVHEQGAERIANVRFYGSVK